MTHHELWSRITVLAGVAVCVALTASAGAQGEQDAFEKIRREGLEHSEADAVFNMLTVGIGARLTASPAHRRAVEWTRTRLAAFGLDNARLEPFPFGRGWTLEKLTIEMVEPRYMPLIGYADAWSASTKGDVMATPIFIGDQSSEQIGAMQSQLANAIVMTQPIITTFVRADRPQPTDSSYIPSSPVAAGRRPEDRVIPPAVLRVEKTLQQSRPAVLVKGSRGEHGTVFVGIRREGSRIFAGGGDLADTPSITLAAEHYNLIARLLQQKVPVTLRINVQSKFYDSDDGNAFNVLAELPGSDPVLRDQVVMIGAHLDSHHTGSGATDNADGVTSVMEAMRILSATRLRPRRTIRVALWGGEEQGLLGSRAWVQQHLIGPQNAANRDKFDVYFNIDNGTGPVFGWYLENRRKVQPLFDAWLGPLRLLGARRNVLEPTGGTDHVTFIDAGVAAFNPIQDYTNYDTRTHHTNVDTEDRVTTSDLRQCAIAFAWFAYQAAMTDQKIPWSPN